MWKKPPRWRDSPHRRPHLLCRKSRRRYLHRPRHCATQALSIWRKKWTRRKPIRKTHQTRRGSGVPLPQKETRRRRARRCTTSGKRRQQEGSLSCARFISSTPSSPSHSSSRSTGRREKSAAPVPTKLRPVHPRNHKVITVRRRTCSRLEIHVEPGDVVIRRIEIRSDTEFIYRNEEI